MDKYAQFEREQTALLNELAEQGPNKALMERMQALYQDAAVVIVLGPSAAVVAQGERAQRDYPDEHDMEHYIRAIENGELDALFENKAWGPVELRYETVSLDGIFCPGVRVTWENKIAFLAEGAGEAYNAKLDAMAAAMAQQLAAKWHQWQVQLL